jgi:hypothetical protein
MKGDSLWHEVSDKEKEEIRGEAKKLLDNFASKLGKVKSKDEHFENYEGSRGEGDGWKTDSEFRDLMLLNAPFVDEDFIVAEKGKWK